MSAQNVAVDGHGLPRKVRLFLGVPTTEVAAWGPLARRPPAWTQHPFAESRVREGARLANGPQAATSDMSRKRHIISLNGKKSYT